MSDTVLPNGTVHELKTAQPFFGLILDGLKPFELRRNDRDFSIGHTLHLREWNQIRQAYTGRETFVKVTYLLEAYPGLEKGFCIMGTTPLRTEQSQGEPPSQGDCGGAGKCPACDRREQAQQSFDDHAKALNLEAEINAFRGRINYNYKNIEALESLLARAQACARAYADSFNVQAKGEVSVKEWFKRALWDAIVNTGEDTIDRLYKHLLSDAGLTDEEIREFCTRMYVGMDERSETTKWQPYNG